MESRGRPNPARSANADSGLADRQGAIPLLVAAICACEVVLVFVNLALGVLLHAIVLGAILSLQAMRSGRDGRAMVALALVPLLRLLSLTMPLPGIEPVYWIGLVGTPLSIGGFLAARAAGLGLDEVGLKRSPWLPQVAITALGVPAGLAAWYSRGPTPFVADGATPGEIILIACLLVVFVAVTEEFIFRGVVQAGLSGAYARGAVLMGAILYGALYLGSLSFGYAVSMTLIGLLYGLLVQRTGSIVGVCASHAILVLGAFLAWPTLLG